jgi:hypothetical protein
MYDPATDQLYQLGVRVEGGAPEGVGYATPYVLVVSDDGTKLFGVAMGGKYVMEYDLSTVNLKPARDAGPYVNGTITCRLAAAFIPGDTHAGTLGPDGCFYFNSTEKLYRYNPRTRTAEELGTITAPDPKRGVHTQGACFGADGTLYLKCIYPYSVLAFEKLTSGAK